MGFLDRRLYKVRGDVACCVVSFMFCIFISGCGNIPGRGGAHFWGGPKPRISRNLRLARAPKTPQNPGFSPEFPRFSPDFGPPAWPRPSKSLIQNPPPHFLLTKKYIY